MWGGDAVERNSLRTQQWPHKLQHQTNSPPLLEQIKSNQTTTNPRKMKLDIVFWITPRQSHLCVLCIPPSPSALRKKKKKTAYIHDVKNIICWAKLKKEKKKMSPPVWGSPLWELGSGSRLYRWVNSCSRNSLNRGFICKFSIKSRAAAAWIYNKDQ